MPDPLSKVSFFRPFPAAWRGAVMCVIVIVGAAAAFGLVFVASRPSTAEADTVAQLGAAFLIAYGVEMPWVVRESSQRGRQYELWLGFVTGLAACGLTGIFIAVGLGDTGQGTSVLRELGFAWSCGSIFMLGAMVAVTPLLTYEWRRQLMTEFDDE